MFIFGIVQFWYFIFPLILLVNALIMVIKDKKNGTELFKFRINNRYLKFILISSGILFIILTILLILWQIFN